MRNRRVLLVEDEFLVREVVADELRDQGFEVITAASGDEAIRLIEEHVNFDALCTDVRMPGKTDGIDVAIHARWRLPSVPVLVISGYAFELGTRLDAFLPSAAFLPKPFTLAQICEILHRLLAGDGLDRDESSAVSVQAAAAKGVPADGGLGQVALAVTGCTLRPHAAILGHKSDMTVA